MTMTLGIGIQGSRSAVDVLVVLCTPYIFHRQLCLSSFFSHRRSSHPAAWAFRQRHIALDMLKTSSFLTMYKIWWQWQKLTPKATMVRTWLFVFFGICKIQLPAWKRNRGTCMFQRSMLGTWYCDRKSRWTIVPEVLEVDSFARCCWSLLQCRMDNKVQHVTSCSTPISTLIAVVQNTACSLLMVLMFFSREAFCSLLPPLLDVVEVSWGWPAGGSTGQTPLDALGSPQFKEIEYRNHKIYR